MSTDDKAPRLIDPHERGENRLSAYYYSFDPTGCDAVDNMLAAVALAGKCYHHTERWGDERDDCDESLTDHIQRMAGDAAAVVASLQAEIAALRGDLPDGWKHLRTHEWVGSDGFWVESDGARYRWWVGGRTKTGTAPTLLEAIAACEAARGAQ